MKKEIYIDIIEKAMACYSEERIQNYVERVREEGLTEHGFARLVSAMGILIAFGRGESFRKIFPELMDFCCAQIPVSPQAANDFSVREICLCIKLLRERKIISEERIQMWMNDLARIVPEQVYHVVAHTPTDVLGNWAVFAAVSDFYRGQLLQIDTSAFVELQFATQMRCFDENGMYRDPHCPLVYDTMPRILFEMALMGGYRGKYYEFINEQLNKASDFALRMQSVTGAMPYGGRSNQCLHNEAMVAADFEYHATRLKNSDPEKARLFKAGAERAAKNLLQSFDFYGTHVKNKFPPDEKFGCEKYAYFDKYMITVASNAYLAYLMADDEVAASVELNDEGQSPEISWGVSEEKVVEELQGSSEEKVTEELRGSSDTKLSVARRPDVFSLSQDFHKTFARGFGWFLEFDTNADLQYDANGLGRIHKEGCAETIALSVPFPAPGAKYRLEKDNPHAMSLCTYAEINGERLYGAEVPCGDAKWNVEEDRVSVVFERVFEKLKTALEDEMIDCEAQKGACLTENASPETPQEIRHQEIRHQEIRPQEIRHQEIRYQEFYELTEDALIIRHTGGDRVGFCLPCIAFDGSIHSVITVEDGKIMVEYAWTVLTYSFHGPVIEEEHYENRNGYYQVFTAQTEEVRVEVKNARFEI